jgi:hypothetical protein
MKMYRSFGLVFFSQNLKKKNLSLVFASLVAFCWQSQLEVCAQATFDNSYPTQPSTYPSTIPTRSQFVSPPPVQATPPPTMLPPPEMMYLGSPDSIYRVAPQGTMAPPPPAFDPFLAQPTSSFPPQNTPFPVFPYPQPTYPQPTYPQPNYSSPSYSSTLQPFGTGTQPPYQSNPWGPQSFQQPTFLGTNANWMPATNWSPFSQDPVARFSERTRARQTFLAGNGKQRQLGMQDVELATTFNWPNFLTSNQPLKISPGFIFHYWDGPSTVDNPDFDLPARAYSPYVSFDHITNPASPAGLESRFTIGYYSDFENSSSQGFRYTGRALLWTRINQYTVGKIGLEYFDRVSLKMLPAFGVFMAPNPDTRFDLLFPQTKLSHRLPGVSDYESWVYVGGEYGGGSWVIDRIGGVGDQVDINDVRAFIGIEWMGPRRSTGFFEAGYVFTRNILYRSDPKNILELSDTLMIRSGFAF